MYKATKTHNLKILPEFFAAIIDGSKKAEFRLNDREYHRGDILHLREFSGGPSFSYTGRDVIAEITHVLPIDSLICPGIMDMRSFVVLSLNVLEFRPRSTFMSDARRSTHHE